MAVKPLRPPKKSEGPETVTVELSADAMRYLRQLKHKGLFGSDVPQVVQTVVYEWLRGACEEGWVE